MPERAKISVTELRRDVKIDSVAQMKSQAELMLAWQHRDNIGEHLPPVTERRTRNQTAGNVTAPDARGHLGKVSTTIAMAKWNDLPQNIRGEDNKRRP